MEYFEQFHIPIDHIQDEITLLTGEVPVAIATDNNEPRTGGHPSLEDIKLRELGLVIKERLTVTMMAN